MSRNEDILRAMIDGTAYAKEPKSRNEELLLELKDVIEAGGLDPENYYTKSQTDSIISGKVDKITGKGLSTEDYTTSEKTKLSGIANNATNIGKLYPNSTNGEVFNSYTGNKASGNYSHAEGINTTASGNYSHAEGNNALASGGYSHAEGNATTASGSYSHAEGSYCAAYASCSHASGNHTIANVSAQTAIGRYNLSDGNNIYAFVIGNGSSTNMRSNAFAVDWNGLIYVGNSATGVDVTNLVEKEQGKGLSTEDYTTAEKTKLAGIETSATNVGQTIPAGTEYSIAGDVYTVGANAEIFNDYTNNKAIGINAHAEGGNNTALGNYAHAEGNTTEAYGAYTHAEGNETRAYGLYSHAEGKNTWTNGTSAHAEGNYTMANYANSHSEGLYTVANSECQHVQGKYNRSDQNNKYAFIIGNGTGSNARSNAFAVDWNGLVYVCDSETGINLNTLASGMNNKVDKITGKGLSTNDYTNAEKTKLGELSTASVTIDLNSQSWTQSANGLFYSANVSISNLLEIYSVIITGFSALKTTDNVTPISNTGRTAVRLTASTDTFSNQASITVSVFGRFTS